MVRKRLKIYRVPEINNLKKSSDVVRQIITIKSEGKIFFIENKGMILHFIAHFLSLEY